MISQFVVEYNIFQIEHRVDERNIAVINIAVHTVDGKSKLSHKGGGGFCVAGRKHRQSRIAVECVVVTCLAWKNLHSAAVGIVLCHLSDCRLVDFIIFHKACAVGKYLIVVELMYHINRVGRYLQETQCQSDGESRSLGGVFSNRKRPEHDRIQRRQSQAVPDHFIITAAAEFLFGDDHAGNQHKCLEHSLASDRLNFVKCLNSYGKHHKAHEE